jgi:glycolate dehydrogenase FAD-binding subunit
MKISPDTLRANLEREVGAGAVRSDAAARAAHSVDGKTPSLICSPSTPEEVSAALRVCSDANAAVVPWGGGTSIELGNIPRAVDVVVALERMAKLVEHDDANLTATIEAGMTVEKLQKFLAEHRQFVPIDPPAPSRATLGGVVAASTNGPRRIAYGGVRDLVIGMKMALATGERIKAGGKVVKNVAGYDLCKLFVGSLGTLGVVTEVTFRVAPLPESVASFVASGALDRCTRFSTDLLHSALLPAAAVLAGVGALGDRRSRSGAIVAWVEGFEESIDRHMRDLREMAGRAGLAAEVLRGGEHDRIWDEVIDFGSSRGGVLFRLNVPIAAIPRVIATIGRAGDFAAAPRCMADVATGTVWVRPQGDSPALDRFAALSALAREHRGHAIVAAAPPELKAGIDVWGEAPAGLALMREIKRRFDPGAMLNPGRFLTGLE